MKDREKDEKDRLARQRPVLRIVTELAMIGAWEKGVEQGVTEISKVLKAFVGVDIPWVCSVFDVSSDVWRPSVCQPSSHDHFPQELLTVVLGTTI